MGVFSNDAAQNLFIQSNQPTGPVKGALWIDSGKTPNPEISIFDGTSFNEIDPTGNIKPWGGAVASIPTGFLLCDGAAVSRTDFANLFAVIASLYGDGDGSTTFNVPDLRGKFQRGAAAAANPGSTGGENTHALTIAELATHTHTQDSHTHGITATTDGGSSVLTIETDVFTTADNKTTGATTAVNQNTGSGTAHENKPEFQEVIYIVKT